MKTYPSQSPAKTLPVAIETKPKPYPSPSYSFQSLCTLSLQLTQLPNTAIFLSELDLSMQDNDKMMLIQLVHGVKEQITSMLQ